eukprot:gene6224-12609_t
MAKSHFVCETRLEELSRKGLISKNNTLLKLEEKEFAIINKDHESIAISLRRLEDICDDKIYIPTWIFDSWNIDEEQLINCSIGSKDHQIINDKDTIIMDYIGYMSHKNFDERDIDECNFGSPSWFHKWPFGLYKSEVELMLPMFISGRCFVNGQLFAVDLLDMSLLFRIYSNEEHYKNKKNITFQTNIESGNGTGIGDNITPVKSTSDPTSINTIITSDGHYTMQIIYLLSNSIDFHVRVMNSISDSNSNEKGRGNSLITSSASSTSESIDNYPRQEYCRNNSNNDNNDINSNNTNTANIVTAPKPRVEYGDGDDHWKGPHSALILAPEGAGKTRCLDTLRQNDVDYDTIQRTEKYVDYNTDKTRKESSFEIVTRLISTLCEHLQLAVIGNIDNNNNNINNNSDDVYRYSDGSRVPPTLIILDDIDELFESELSQSIGRTDDDNESSPASSSSNTFNIDSETGVNSELSALALRKLLAFVSSAPFRGRCVLIAATRLPRHRLPSTLASTPGFELVFEILRPSRSDRAVVLRELLGPLGSFSSSSVIGALQPLSDMTEVEGGGGGRNTTIDDNHRLLSAWASRTAAITPGYLPGDLCAVVRMLLAISANKTYLSQSGVSRPLISWRDMLTAVSSVQPRQLTELGLSSDAAQTGTNKDSLSWDDFGGYVQEKSLIKKLLRRLAKDDEGPVTNGGGDGDRDRDSNRNLMNKIAELRGIVLYGPPGCGKTYLARVIAAEAAMNFVTVRSPEILSRYFGQTEAAIRALFAKARAAAPCVLFFDDFDALACRRSVEGDDSSSSGSSAVEARVLSTFLNELDGISSYSSSSSATAAGGNAVSSTSSGVLLLAACSSLDILDEALLRPGRLQHHVHLQLPSKEDIINILEVRMKNLPISDDIDTEYIANKLLENKTTPSCADIDALLRHVIQSTIKESISKISLTSTTVDKFEVGCNESIFVCSRHFDSAFMSMFESEDSLFEMDEDSSKKGVDDIELNSTFGSNSQGTEAGFSWIGDFSPGNL